LFFSAKKLGSIRMDCIK